MERRAVIREVKLLVISPSRIQTIDFSSRPKNDPELVTADKHQFIDDQRQSNAIEGKIGQGKRRYGLALICDKLPVTQGSSIAMNILVMNLQKLLELLFVFFVFLWQLLAACPGVQSANKGG